MVESMSLSSALIQGVSVASTTCLSPSRRTQFAFFTRETVASVDRTKRNPSDIAVSWLHQPLTVELIRNQRISPSD